MSHLCQFGPLMIILLLFSVFLVFLSVVRHLIHVKIQDDICVSAGKVQNANRMLTKPVSFT